MKDVTDILETACEMCKHPLQCGEDEDSLLDICEQCPMERKVMEILSTDREFVEVPGYSYFGRQIYVQGVGSRETIQE